MKLSKRAKIVMFSMVAVLALGLLVSGVILSNLLRQEVEPESDQMDPGQDLEEEAGNEGTSTEDGEKGDDELPEELVGGAPKAPEAEKVPEQPSAVSSTGVLGNCTMQFGNLMLINPNFRVEQDFIVERRGQLVSVSQTYGIPEYNYVTNGDNLLTAEAAVHLAEMVKAYEEAYPGHTMGTRSCFRVKGTSCGRLCAATGTSDHHTGLTCDLIDTTYGTNLNTDDYGRHVEWQWLKANSYKYGFIDRFPVAWAGGSMSEPLNVDANGTTGLFETWHYRYVGVTAATEIATGKYNNGEYDSLEHYLKMTGKVADLKNGVCER